MSKVDLEPYITILLSYFIFQAENPQKRTVFEENVLKQTGVKSLTCV